MRGLRVARGLRELQKCRGMIGVLWAASCMGEVSRMGVEELKVMGRVRLDFIWAGLGRG